MAVALVNVAALVVVVDLADLNEMITLVMV